MNDHISSEDLAAFVDGRLSAESRSAVENHIAGCPECLDELAEVTALLENRQEKIPARFLEQALGEKGKAGRSVLPLRLVFEVAAAVVVVVFIGYLFLGNNRFWQVPEQKQPAEAAERKDIQPAAPAVAAGREPEIDATRQNRRRTAPADADKNGQHAAPADAASRDLEAVPAEQWRDRADSEKMRSGLDRSVDEKILGDRSSLKKAEAKTADKIVPASPVATAPVLEKEDRLQAKLEEQPQAAVANETAPQKVAAAEPTASGAAGGVTQDLAVQNQAVDKAKKGKAAPLFPVRIEGEAGVSDLRNPELLSAWSWLAQGLALELGIDGAGNVVEVVSEGKFAPGAAGQAESEARKLLFSASTKKLRRARVVAER